MNVDSEPFPETFDDPVCDAPAFLDPLHPGEVSCRCVLKSPHPGVDHLGCVPVRWPAREEAAP